MLRPWPVHECELDDAKPPLSVLCGEHRGLEADYKGACKGLQVRCTDVAEIPALGLIKCAG